MRRALAYLCLFLFAMGLIVTDALVLTSNAVLAQMVRDALYSKFGSKLSFEDVAVTLGGEVTLNKVKLSVKNLDIFKSDEARITLERLSSRPREIELRNVHIRLSEDAIQGLREEPELQGAGGPPEEVPFVTLVGGQVEFENATIFQPGRHPVFRLDRVTLVKHPSGVLIATGHLHHDVLGMWELAVIDTGTSFEATATTEALDFTPQVRDMLGENIRREMDKAKPSGRAGIRVRVFRGPKDSQERFTVTILAKDLSLAYAAFPYRVEHGIGELEFRADGFTIKNFMGEGNGGKIAIQGICENYAYEGSFDMNIQMKDVPLDGKMRDAMPPRARETVDAFEARGKMDVYARVFKVVGSEEKIQVAVHLMFREAHLKYRIFPYELEGASGELFIQEPNIEIRRVVAPAGGGRIQISGKIVLTPDDMRIDVRAHTEDLPLDAHLREALHGKALEIFDAFKARGRTNMDWHTTKAPGGQPRHEFVAMIANGACEHRACPIPLSELSGVIEGVIDEPTIQVTIQKLTGEYEGSRIRLSGKVVNTGDALNVDLEIRALGLKFTDGLINRLPKDISKVLGKARLRGETNLDGKLQIHQNGKSSSRSFTLALDLSGAALDLDVKFEQIEGRVSVSVVSKDDEPFSFLGTADLSNIRVQGKRFNRLSTSFNYQNDTLCFLQILGNAYDGTVTGKFKFNTETGEYTGSLRANSMDLQEYRLDTEAYSKKKVQGRVNFELQALSGVAGDKSSVKGRGRLQILDGYLWEIPAFLKIFSLDPTKFAQHTQFDFGDVNFKIGEGKATLESVVFRGENTMLFGEGTLDFDWKLDLRLKLETKVLGDFWLFKPIDFIWNNLSSAFWGIVITGPFESPEAGWKLIPGVRK